MNEQTRTLAWMLVLATCAVLLIAESVHVRRLNADLATERSNSDKQEIFLQDRIDESSRTVNDLSDKLSDRMEQIVFLEVTSDQWQTAARDAQAEVEQLKELIAALRVDLRWGRHREAWLRYDLCAAKELCVPDGRWGDCVTPDRPRISGTTRKPEDGVGGIGE